MDKFNIVNIVRDTMGLVDDDIFEYLDMHYKFKNGILYKKVPSPKNDVWQVSVLHLNNVEHMIRCHKNILFIPKYGETYFYIFYDNIDRPYVRTTRWDDVYFDHNKLLANNVFITKEHAENAMSMYMEKIKKKFEQFKSK